MSIFDLNTTGVLPPVNQGLSKYRYEKITALRNVTGTNFPGGPIDFRWTTGGNSWYVPVRSPVVIRVQISAGNSTQFLRSLGAAPAMGFCATLFQKGSFKLEETELSIISDFIAEIDALDNRMSKSGAWLNGTGGQMNLWNGNFTERLNYTAYDGYKHVETRPSLGFLAAETLTIPMTLNAAAGPDPPGTIEVGTFSAYANGIGDLRTSDVFRPGDILEVLDGGLAGLLKRFKVVAITGALTMTLMVLDVTIAVATAAGADPFTRIRYEDVPHTVGIEFIWIPPFSVNKLPHALPVGNYTLSLTPQTGTNYEIRAVESIGTGLVTGVAAANIQVRVKEMFYYVCTMAGPRLVDTTYYLDLDEVNCQARQISATANAQEPFTVSKKTYALTTAFSNQGAGSVTNQPVSRFIIDNEDHEKLTLIQVDFASQSKPPQQPDMTFANPDDAVADLNNYMTRRYTDTYMYNGLMFDPAGPESFHEWLSERGPYYYLPFPKDADDDSTQVIVRYGFRTGVGGATFAANTARMLLFNHFKKMAIVNIVNGKVESVTVQER